MSFKQLLQWSIILFDTLYRNFGLEELEFGICKFDLGWQLKIKTKLGLVPLQEIGEFFYGFK